MLMLEASFLLNIRLDLLLELVLRLLNIGFQFVRHLPGDFGIDRFGLWEGFGIAQALFERLGLDF